MQITVDISMYPLEKDYKPAIKAFIKRLREFQEIQLVTNQMSTQVRGESDRVFDAVHRCMSEAMQNDGRVVFAAKYINAGLNVTELPDIS